MHLLRVKGKNILAPLGIKNDKSLAQGRDFKLNFLFNLGFFDLYYLAPSKGLNYF